MKFIKNQLLFLVLFVFVALDSVIDWARKSKKKFTLVGVALVFCVVFVAGCGKQNIETTLPYVSMVSNITELTQAWGGNKAALVRYRDMLPPDDQDSQRLGNIITQGDKACKMLTSLVLNQAVPTVSKVRLIFLDADSAVQDGSGLYQKYKTNISPPDKFRASLFSASWGELRSDIDSLTRNTTENDRYSLTRNILTTLLQVTAQVIIPTLQSTGKI